MSSSEPRPDSHIAEVARAAAARVVVTDNRRHFMAALRHGLRVEAPSEFLAGLKNKADFRLQPEARRRHYLGTGAVATSSRSSAA